jgi:valyl-tRNA synthetase
MAALATPGHDVKPSRARIEGYRNFATKIWNASRFCQMNECRPDPAFDPAAARETVNRWILTSLGDAIGTTDRALAEFRFNDAAETVYHFVWGTFCDWYVELIKPILDGDDPGAKAETRATASQVLKAILKLLHPFMPFVTEALWKEVAEERTVLALSRWPRATAGDLEARAEIDRLIELVSAIRSVRSEMNVPPAAKARLVAVGDAAIVHELAAHSAAIERLARVDGISSAAEAPKGSAQIVVGGVTLALPLAGMIDIAAETTRLEKEIARADAEIARIDKKLANEKFVAKAPEEVVAAEREKRAAYGVDRQRLEVALKRILESA